MVVEANEQMNRLRNMLDDECIEWTDESNGTFCRAQNWMDDDTFLFSVVCGPYAYGTLEVWSSSMKDRGEDPIGVDTAEEALEIIKDEIGKFSK